ncbi:MAG TPA: diguanylate cyclase [Terriglobales bacterium]|nr:diguanylate cyclase [Terriglobales bacterium]
MNSLAANMVILPGIVALLLFLVFTYLYEQSRQPYFRAWQLGWGAYSLHFGLDAWNFRQPSAWVYLASSLLIVVMALCLFVSTRLMRERFRLRWYDVALAASGVGLTIWSLRTHIVKGVFRDDLETLPHVRLEIGIAALLLYCSMRFYLFAHRRNSLAFRMLALALALWGGLMAVGQLVPPYSEVLGNAGHMLGPLPQMLLGIAMVMVLFENERNAVQENALAFSTLGVDPRRLLSAEDLVPSMTAVLDRLINPLPTRRAVICIAEQWRGVLPSVQRGFSPEIIQKLEKTGAGEYIVELAYRRGGFFTFRNMPEMTEPLPALPGGKFEDFKRVVAEEHIRHLTAVSLQTREHNFGVILFPHAELRVFGSSNLRLLIGLALQIGLTLENYVVMHDAQRRTKEYELLTEIGQAISSRLDQDEILRTIQKELGQIFDTSEFYIAFQEGDQICFELETENNEVLPKRSRRVSNGLTELIIRTGQALLIRSDLEKTRERLGVVQVGGRAAKCFCGAPIMLGGRPAGAIVAMNTEHEYVFQQRDLEVMQTAAGQLSVAVENARLFAEELRRSKQLSFLNSISKMAISSEDAEQMLADIVAEIQKTFQFDHIGIGILDYVTKEIEIRAEAGATAHSRGKRIPLGTGIVGRVARSNERALVQNAGDGHLVGVLPDSRAVLCIPITYGESLLGVLNVESRQENAFSSQDVLIMSTLADLLATALHNTFVFQKLQQQSITDGLTGIKTRRFFWEALSSEWKRASRSGRPFSVVLIDLDKFKDVNDTFGHLEGDLVLARVGRLLEQRCRQSNVVARYGGDEFVILMPETSVDQAHALAERLRLWLAQDAMLAEHHISGSFGVASFPAHGFSAEDIIRVADAGMYSAKHSGGNRVSMVEEFSDGENVAAQRQQLSTYIEGFLQKDRTRPKDLEDLTSTLHRLCGEDCNVQVLKESIEALARAGESREFHAAGHGEMVGRYTELIGRALALPPDELVELVYAAKVHDVGKIFVPERILTKQGPLNEEEFAQMKEHARIGAEIVATIPGSVMLQKAVEHHHEAFDGSGYPNGLRGEEIPLWARIVALADAFVNMTTERGFAAAKTTEQALAEIEKLSGTRYDGMLVRVLLRQLKTGKAPSLGD